MGARKSFCSYLARIQRSFSSLRAQAGPGRGAVRGPRARQGVGGQDQSKDQPEWTQGSWGQWVAQRVGDTGWNSWGRPGDGDAGRGLAGTQGAERAGQIPGRVGGRVGSLSDPAGTKEAGPALGVHAQPHLSTTYSLHLCAPAVAFAPPRDRALRMRAPTPTPHSPRLYDGLITAEKGPRL